MYYLKMKESIVESKDFRSLYKLASSVARILYRKNVAGRLVLKDDERTYVIRITAVNDIIHSHHIALIVTNHTACVSNTSGGTVLKYEAAFH